MSPVLEVRGLRKHFRVVRHGVFAPPVHLKAVDRVGFSIDRGRTLGVVGESGCGKSTLARLSLGLMAPTGGDISFDGSPVSSRRDKAWRALRRQMQMIYQDPLSALDPRTAIGRQIVEPLVIHGIGTRAERLERMREVVDAVGIRLELTDRFPHELSGGQRQRVVIARALIGKPALLVCDEPISSLDVSVAAQVINLLMDLQERLSLSYLFISHDLKVVRQVSDQVAVMYLGRIVEQGPPEALFHAPAHPYTQALVSAIPTLRRRKRHKINLSGEPPNPIDVPTGCPFHPRCPVASERCRIETPSLRRAQDGRLAACHLVPAAAMAHEPGVEVA